MSYPDSEPDSDMVCPNCKDPSYGQYVGEMDEVWDEDGYSAWVSLWVCCNCDHEFSEDEALSLSGVIEDEETTPEMRKQFETAKAMYEVSKKNKSEG